MKKALFILFALISITTQGQVANGTETKQNAFRSLSPQTATTVNFLTTMGIDGTMGKVAPVNVTIPTVPVNYSVSTPTLGAHLSGIDTRLGQISSTTAGLTQRIYFTADNTTVNSVVYFASNSTSKGSTSAGSPPNLVLADNTKGYFTKDIISIPQPAPTIGYAGSYSGNLTVSATPTPIATQQRFTVEVYRTDNLGNPIASGVSGAPVGDLGVTVVAILDSGIINLTAGSITNVSITGILTQNITINTGERLRYHVSAAKIGAGGGNVTFGVYYGSSYNSYYDVPVAITTDAVLNKSTVTGLTDTDALNNLASYNVTETTGTFSNIQTLINANPAGTTINLKPNTTYVQQGSLTVKEGITINGNGATLQRGAQVTTTLTVSANQASTSITVAAIPSNLAIGDRLSVYTDDTAGTSSQPAIITNIVGLVITLKAALAHSNLPTYTWPIGAIVRKDYDQITTPYNVSDVPVATTYTVRNLILDGNKANNAGSFYWAVNSGVFNNGKSIFSKCKFINMPNENIMGHGISVKDSYAQDLNGSFIHQSADITLGEDIFGGEISGNTTKNTNIKATPSITGHSEGVICFSFSSGRVAVIGNRFLGGGEAVLGIVASSINAIDGANKNFIFTGNYAENFTKVVSAFNYFSSGFVTNVDNWFVNNNTFSNCGVDDWSTYASNIANMGVMKFTSNILSNGTVISNIPEKMKEGFLLNGGTVNNIPKYNSTGYLTAGSITDNGTNVVHTRPIFKAASSNGTLVSPVWDKNIFSGLLGTHESGIEFGNTLTNNNGTMVRIRVNDRNNANTPLYPMTYESDGSTTVSSLIGTGTRTVVADANGKLSATDIVPTSGTYTPTVTNALNITGAAVSNVVYTRVKDIVTVTVSVVGNVTSASTATNITLSLPITRVATTSDLVGSVSLFKSGFTNLSNGVFQMNSNTTEVAIASIPTATGATSFVGSFSYKVN